MTVYVVRGALLAATIILGTASGRAGTGNPPWTIPLGELTATRERPIFSPLRRPPAASTTLDAQPSPPAKSPQPEGPQLSLVGTVAGDKKSFGIFLDHSANTVLRLKTGEGHRGWILREVRGRKIILEKGNATSILTLPVRPPQADEDQK